MKAASAAVLLVGGGLNKASNLYNKINLRVLRFIQNSPLYKDCFPSDRNNASQLSGIMLSKVRTGATGEPVIFNQYFQIRGSMKEDRIRWISMAQVSASFAVVMLHCNGVFWQFPTGRLWYTSNFIECFFYWAVPAFFMISGATLLDYQDRYSTSTFLKKRLLRTAVPFVAWSCIGIIYSVHFEGLEISGWKEILDG